jgi:hypothetical protein
MAIASDSIPFWTEGMPTRISELESFIRGEIEQMSETRRLSESVAQFKKLAVAYGV